VADTFNPAQPGSIEQSLLATIPKHTFTIPDDKFEDGKDGVQVLVRKGVREFESDPHEVTLRQLTYSEELQALQAATTRSTNYQYEGAMRSIIRADGKPITWESNQKESFFSGLSQGCRELILRAFSSISLPTVQATQDFLASEKVTLD
jgi:hypothetical protein